MTEIITKTENRNRLLFMFVLRNVLGLILIVKGILFIKDTTELSALIQQTGIGLFSQNAQILAFVIATLNIVGGVFITIGLLTRASSIVQIPIIIVAAFFVNIKNIDYGIGELLLSLFVLVLLIVFAIRGSDSLSADAYFRSVFRKGNRGNTARNNLEK